MKTGVNMGFSFSILIFLILAQIVCSFRWTNVTIPSYAVMGGSAELECGFILETDTLLVLKWYKSEQEFFRYTPDSTGFHEKLTFPVTGVNVDLSKSSLHKIFLRNISLASSGQYQCEVSLHENFRTVNRQGSMVVIATPQSLAITGIHSAVNLGDRVIGNCTSLKSKPAATLALEFNTEKPEAHELIYYHPIQEENELQTSVIGFNFTVENRHFLSGVLRLTCISTIANFYYIKTINISDANIKAQLSFPGHNRLSAGARRLGGIRDVLLCICSVFFVLKGHVIIANLS